MPDRASTGGGPSHSHSRSRYHLRTSRGLIPLPAYPSRSQLIGPFPAEAWIVVMQFLPVPDLPQLLLCNKKLAALGKDDRLWRVKLAWLDYKGPGAILGWRDRGSKGHSTASLGLKSEEKGSAAQEPYRDEAPAIARSTIGSIPPPSAAATSAADVEDDFGDFLDVGEDDDETAVGASRRTRSGAAGDEDGFGAFQDPDGAGNDPFGLADGFSDISLEPTRPGPAAGPSSQSGTFAAAAADDLLVLFDDEADGVLAASQGTLSGVAAQDTHHEADSAGTPVDGRSRASTLSLRRPPAVSHLTFATPPVLASPKLVDPADRSAGAGSTSSGGTFSFSQGTWTDEGSASTVADGLTPPVGRAALGSRTHSSASSMGFPVPVATSTPAASDPEPAQQDAAVIGPLLHVYQKHVSLLLPFYTSLQTQSTSSLVFTVSPPLSPRLRARLLASLLRFTHPLCAPTRSRPQRVTVQRNIQSATDFFESTLLAEFARADDGTGAGLGKAEGGRDEEVMKDKAAILWELNASTTLSQVFVQKRETLFGSGHDPLRNLV